jgi:transcription initiation factor TFIIIB Brf1 subunit/transcription initiation factor TFIIB
VKETSSGLQEDMQVTIILLLRVLLRSITIQTPESEVVVLCLLVHLLRRRNAADVVEESAPIANVSRKTNGATLNASANFRVIRKELKQKLKKNLSSNEFVYCFNLLQCNLVRV